MRHIAPPGSCSLCNVPRRNPGIRDCGESAQSKPSLKTLAEITRAIELDAARADRDPYRNIAHPHPRHRPQVGRDKQADVKSRIGRANADLAVVAEEPPGPFRHRQIGKIELDRDAAGRKGARPNGRSRCRYPGCGVSKRSPQVAAGITGALLFLACLRNVSAPVKERRGKSPRISACKMVSSAAHARAAEGSR
jgi:hypothetical protein